MTLGGVGDPDSSARAPRLEAEIASWLDSLSSENTRNAYGRDLRAFIAWTVRTHPEAPLDTDGAFTADQRIRSFLAADRVVGASDSTVRRRQASIGSFARFVSGRATTTESTSARPVSRRPSPTLGLSPAEAQEVWAIASREGAREAALVGLLLFDGLKLFEILALDDSHVDGRGAALSVDLVRHGRRQTVSVDTRSARPITVLLRTQGRGPLFLGRGVSASGSRLTRFGADYLMKGLGVASGLDDSLTANRLRATCIATALGERETDVVRDAVGHVDRRSTLRFVTTESSPSPRSG